MKNLKKVLAVVLAFAMIIGMNAFAASFSDVEKGASYAEAVNVLADLGMLKGYEENGTVTFKPEANITRAEFAAVVCRIKGLEDAANSAKGATQFTDVAADSWASGYINMATQQGIINGVGGGLFLPDENVKFEEAVKMVVAALGYSPKAEGMGGYPTGYLAVGSQINVTKGVSGANGAAANRGTVARLAYNALDVPLMEQVSYGTGSVQYQPGDKILLDSLDLVKVEAVITDIPGSSGNSNDLKANEVRLEIKKHYIAYDGKLMISAPTADNTYSDLSWTEDKVDAGTTNAKDYLNKSVIAYLQGAYDDDVVIKAIVEKSGKNPEETFRSEDVYPKYTDMTKQVPEIAFYDDAENSSSYTRVTLEPGSDFTLYVNDIEFSKGEDNIKEILPNDLIEHNDAKGTFKKLIDNATGDNAFGFDVRLLDNDTDSEYDVAYIDVYTDLVVDIANANTFKITSKNGSRSITLDPEERNASFTIVNQDGSKAAFEDIKENTVLSIRKGIVEDKKLITGQVMIINNSVTGKITEVSESDKEITVGDKTYKVETYQSDIEFDTLRTNTEAMFYINARGNIFYMDKSAIVNNMKVGFATKLGGSGNGLDTGKQIQMMNEAGEWVTYDLANKVTINEDVSSVSSDTAKYEDYDVLKFEDKSEDNTEKTLRKIKQVGDTGVYVINSTVSYDLNSNGEVYKLNFTPRQSRVIDPKGYGYTAWKVSGTYKVSVDAAGSVYLTDKSILFSVDLTKANQEKIDGNTAAWDTITTLDQNDISVLKKDALIDNQDIKAYAVNCDDESQAKALIGLDLVNALVANSNLMVITGVSSTTNADGDNVKKLTGLVNGEEIEVFVSSETDPSATTQAAPAGEYAKGDVVVYQRGAGDELKSVAKVFSVANQFNSDGTVKELNALDISSTIIRGTDSSAVLDPAVDDTKVEFYYGYARNLRSSNLTIVQNENSDDVTTDLSFKSANVVVYDKFEGRDPKIEDTDLSEVEYDRVPDGTIDGDYVFVRVVDGIAKDAVIIKTK